jgi:hypothetical protein
MEFAFVAALAAAAGIAGYLIFRRAKSVTPAAEFVCLHCNEKHCECESTPEDQPHA